VTNLAFLLIAVVLSAVGVLVLWLRNRPTSSPTATIDEFSEKMRALAPDDDGSRPGEAEGRRGG
jgi:hypothetical protein